KLAALQFLVGQAGIFATEHQRHLTTLPKLLQSSGRALARIKQRPGNAPITGTGAERDATTGQRLLQRSDHPGIVEDIGGAGGTRYRLTAGEVLRIDQHQARQPHIFHGTRSATYVAGMTGIDQDHTNVLQQRRLHLGWERAANVTEAPDLTPCATTSWLHDKYDSARMAGSLL